MAPLQSQPTSTKTSLGVWCIRSSTENGHVFRFCIVLRFAASHLDLFLTKTAGPMSNLVCAIAATEKKYRDGQVHQTLFLQAVKNLHVLMVNNDFSVCMRKAAMYIACKDCQDSTRGEENAFEISHSL